MTARPRVKLARSSLPHKEERLRALAESAVRARRFSAAETLDVGFELVESGRSLSRAAEETHARRGA